MTEKEKELCDLLLSLPSEEEEEIPHEHTYAKVVIVNVAKRNNLIDEFIKLIKGLDNPTIEEVSQIIFGDLPPLKIVKEDDNKTNNN